MQDQRLFCWNAYGFRLKMGAARGTVLLLLVAAMTPCSLARVSGVKNYVELSNAPLEWLYFILCLKKPRSIAIYVFGSASLTCKGTCRQVLICLRPPGVVKQFCRFGILSNTQCICWDAPVYALHTTRSPAPPPPVTHCINTYPCTYSHREGGRRTS